MKNGKSITELAAQLQSIRDTAKDIVVPVAHLEKVTAIAAYKDEVLGGDQPATTRKELFVQVQNDSTHTLAPSPWAHSQLAEYADIPKAYYDRVLGENPSLTALALNHGFAIQAGIAASQKGIAGRMLRTHGGKLRAMVSSRYRTLDNFDLFEAIAPALIDLGFEPESVELTDKRLYLKVLSPKIESEVSVGDTVQYGLVVSNSDVGAGSVRVEPLLYRLVCKNGMISSTAIRKAHLGRNLAGDDISDLLSDRTKELSDAAFWNQIRDVVVNTAKPEFFEREVNRLREAKGVALKLFDIPEVVERAAREAKITINENVKKSIIDNLANGADGAGMNKWGLANAFTYAAGSVESLSYDDATELERAGSKIIELSPRSWEVINASK